MSPVLLRRLGALGALVGAALGACTGGRASAPPVPPPEPAAPPAPVLLASAQAPELAASEPPDASSSSSPTPGSSPAPGPPLVSFEPSYPATARPTFDDTFVSWNRGGASQPRTSSAAYQPVPRVVVYVEARDKTPLRPASARLLDSIQAEARDKGYWPFRRCFEAGLHESPNLEGETRIAFWLTARGNPLKPRLVDSKLQSREVARCLLGALEQLRFKHRPAKRWELITAIRLWPGDGPPPEAPALDPNAPPAPFDPARTTARIQEQTPEFVACYLQARAKDPALWGRLALYIMLERDGTVHRIEESESSFPDASLVRCVQATIARLVFEPVLGQPFAFVQPLRFGAPPTD